MTNFEVIKKEMSLLKFAKLMDKCSGCPPSSESCNATHDCVLCWSTWLSAEAKSSEEQGMERDTKTPTSPITVGERLSACEAALKELSDDLDAKFKHLEGWHTNLDNRLVALEKWRES